LPSGDQAALPVLIEGRAKSGVVRLQPESPAERRAAWIDRLVNRQLAVAGEPAPDVLAVHERHDVVEESLGLARVVQREDVGVLQPGGDLDLAEEAVRTQRGGQLGAQDLERHFAAVLEILREIHRRHPALSQLALQAIAVGQGVGQSGRNVGHRAT